MRSTDKLMFINEAEIESCLKMADATLPASVREVLAKAREMKGLDLPEVASLMAVRSAELREEIFETARALKHEIYGSRVVLFAPLYLSNRCGNDCSYCAFCASNREVRRRTLTQAEIASEAKVLIEQGHKRVLLVAGESMTDQTGLAYVLEAIRTVYGVRSGRGEMRRVHVNVAPLSVEQFRELRAADIGAYQIFQETYHRKTYAEVHKSGPKRDYDWRLGAMDRAMEAGLGDVGIGPLFGLYDWRFEVLALLQHVRHLVERFGCGPHTISVPRLEPAIGSDIASHPPYAVSDDDFLLLIAILRLAVPYTGLVMSTRESGETRRRSLQLGISQISAGSRTDPGGYEESGTNFDTSQFAVGDRRPLDVVVREIAGMGFTPSFCTACYRSGRTGADFMELAKPGDIKYHCEPNALSTFAEYVEDYASPETQAAGNERIAQQLTEMDERQRRAADPLVRRIRDGERDVFI